MDRERSRIAGTRGSKRKLGFESESERDDRRPVAGERRDLAAKVRAQVDVLSSTFLRSEEDRVLVKSAVKIISEYARDDVNVNMIIDCGAIPVLVRHLQHPPLARGGEHCTSLCDYEVEKECAFTLGQLAINYEYQVLIVRAGALSPMIDLLKGHKDGYNCQTINCVIRKTADAITHLAHENSNIKTLVRIEGGIPPLIELLESTDLKVQRAAAGALRTLAFKNEKNKIRIVECNALPALVQLLRSEDATIHCEAVGVIGNLVHLSPNIKKEVLLAGALQPVIGLLNSCCTDSKREAALLLGQFATADSECKVHIVQRGAVPPLIDMLQSHDEQLKEMSAFALGRLAQDMHNQAGIVHSGGLSPLLKLLDSKNGSFQHNAAFALYGLADNEDNVADFIMLGGVQKLQDVNFTAQPTKDCVTKTLKRIEEKIHGRVLKHLLYLLRLGEKAVQKQIALALAHLCASNDLKSIFIDNNGIAHLCASDDLKSIFIDNNGLELLLGLLDSANHKQRKDGSEALYKLATKIALLSPIDAAPLSPTPQVYLGEQYVNNPTLSDVTFLIEGKQFYAHRICLLASSDAFRAMFDGGYRESDANDITIPNIRWDVFELMMRFIYTGSVDLSLDSVHDLLRAADQYLLDGLKCLCEHTIAQDISVENVPLVYELSETFSAVSLKKSCILFILEQSDKLRSKPWYTCLIRQIIPEIRNYFTKALTKSSQDPSEPIFSIH